MASQVKKCTVCERTKHVADFYKHGQKPHLYHSECKSCTNDAARASWKSLTPEAQRMRQRANKLKINFGLSLEQYDRMLQEQGGRCAICGTDEPDGRGLFPVDHCHRTGIVRGLLCTRCNTGIGMFGDDPEIVAKAVLYLTQRRD